MTGPRIPCRSCGTRIDQDWTVCPQCGADDPHREYRRFRRRATVAAVAAAVVVLAVAAALVIPAIF